MLHTGGERVHTSSYSADGETRLDNWVRVEKHRLDHIQNICVSVQVEHLQVNKSLYTEKEQ